MFRTLASVRARLGVLALVLAVAAPIHAQQAAAIRGRVTDAATGQPLAEAQVVVLGRTVTAVTGADGAYQLNGLPAEALELRVRRVGFAPQVRRVVATGAGAVADFRLVAAATELTPVTVTATRDERSTADVAAAVTVVDSMVLKTTRSAGLHEVLRYTPGVQATSRFGLDDVNISIRGSGIRTTFGVRGVAVMLDGVPITEPDGLTRLDLVELASAKQVEAVRGPASALYGGVASGGVINIISKSGAETRGVQFRAQGGSFDFQKYDGQVGTTFDGGKGSVFLSGAHTYSDGFRAFNRNMRTRFNGRLTYQLTPTTRLGLEASTSDLDMNIPGAQTLAEFTADPFAAVNAPNIVNQYARRDQRVRAGLRLDQSLDVGRPLALTAYGFYGDRQLDHPIFQVIDQDLQRFQGGVRAQLPIDRAVDARVRLAVGADVDHLYGNSDNYANVRGQRGALVASVYQSLPTVGTYGQLEARLTDRLGLTGGLRYDRVRYKIFDQLNAARNVFTDFTQFSPKGTLTYRLVGATSLYASVARGFEVPTSGEFTTSPDPTRAFNDQLQPKRLTNYEVGLKALVASKLALDVALFNADITGEFISRTIPTVTGPRTIFENAGRSRNRGLEVGWTALAASWLDVVGSYTYSDFRLRQFSAPVVQPNGSALLTDFSGNRLPGVPEHRLTGELRLRPADRLTVGVGAEWQSRTFVDNANSVNGIVYFRPFGSPTVQSSAFGPQPAYALAHLNASYRLAFATVFGNIENVFDKRYVGSITVNDGTGRFYSAGAGRYLAVGLSLAALPGGF